MLTTEEKQELLCLRSTQFERKRALLQEEFDRLQYLFKKQYHNHCKNPHCTGYIGEENETYCNLCNGELIKSI